jgi:hypothetical protein
MSSSVGSQAAFQKRVAAMQPSLSKAEAMVLGLLSFGMVMLSGYGISRLSKELAKIEQVPAGRLRCQFYTGINSSSDPSRRTLQKYTEQSCNQWDE